MKRKTKILIIASPVVFTALLLTFFLINRRNPLYFFPMWKDVPPRESAEAVEVLFERIEYGYETGYGTKHDGVRVTLRNRTNWAAGYGEGFSVDYLHEGDFHTVYMPESVTSIGIMLSAHGSQEQMYLVPPGLFSLPGTYRLYIDGMGQCEFQIFEQD